MNFKRISTVLGIILILSCAVVLINTTKENIIHRKQIESKLDLKDEEKKNLNYRHLVEDIKSVEEGKSIKYAKQASSETQNSGNGVKLVVYDKEYKGDGYSVRIMSAIDQKNDTKMYEFIRNDECVYCVSTDTIDNLTGKNKAFSRATKNIVVYGLLGIITVIEIVLLVMSRKDAMNKDKQSVNKA